MQRTSTASTATRTLSSAPVFREGQEANEMYVIKSGKVKITKNMYGIMVKIAELGPGDAFGEMAVLEGIPRSASALAEGKVELEVYSRKALTDRVATDPQFAVEMLKTMSQRLREIDARVTDLVAKGRLPKEDAAIVSQYTYC